MDKEEATGQNQGQPLAHEELTWEKVSDIDEEKDTSDLDAAREMAESLRSMLHQTTEEFNIIQEQFGELKATTRSLEHQHARAQEELAQTKQEALDFKVINPACVHWCSAFEQNAGKVITPHSSALTPTSAILNI